jgi:dipeptidyl aminopeptidase/acylaminoacyl peptidase
MIERAGGDPVRLTDDALDPVSGGIPLTEPQPLAWVGGRILFLANARGASGIYAVTPRTRGGVVETLRAEHELATGIAFAADGTRAALLSSTLRQPGEIAIVDLATGKASAVTAASGEYLATRAVGRTERFAVRRGDLSVDCWLTFPPGFDRTKRYPLVLTVHGGPNGFYGDGWYAGQQLLAAAGYLVLWTNPRGSATYGLDFVQRVFEDWGGEDYLDQMAAVDAVCRRPYVDADRLGVQGYSYGGFMTSWIIGHSQRFKAAVVGAPVVNLVSMYGTTDIAVVFGERQWGGTPWTNFEQYVARSPLTYAPQVTAPVLLLHGEADIRCPIAQSEEYYVALKRLGKTVEFVRFPGGYHGFANSGHVNLRQAYYDGIREWFDRWLR